LKKFGKKRIGQTSELESANWPIQNPIFATKSSYAFSQTALEKVALLGSWFRAQSEKISSES
jgi:hypothetical protein